MFIADDIREVKYVSLLNHNRNRNRINDVKFRKYLLLAF